MVYLAVKRAIDIVAASTGLLVSVPLLLFLALAVKRTSPGPVLYRAKRVGKRGHLFELLKFRTMIPNAECLGGSATANDDVRLTSFGKKIRKYKLDELPQLWNVLRGEISLVGPRPEVEKFVAKYSKMEQRILTIEPGLTDWATIWNSDEGAALAGSSDPERFYEEYIRPTKIELQLLYCDTRCLTVDCKILVHTAIKLFRSSWVPKEIAAYGSSLQLKETLARTS